MGAQHELIANRDDVVLVRKAEWWPMRVLGWALGESFMNDFFTTYRPPFSKRTRIAYPSDMTLDAASVHPSIAHEVLHVDQYKPWWAPFVVPIAACFGRGRWLIERGPFLADIIIGRRTVEQAVETLWVKYRQPAPREEMRAWFHSQLGRFL